MSALEKTTNLVALDEQPAEQAGIFLETYTVTTDMVAIQGIQSMITRYQQFYGNISQRPGDMGEYGPKSIQIWAEA